MSVTWWKTWQICTIIQKPSWQIYLLINYRLSTQTITQTWQVSVHNDVTLVYNSKICILHFKLLHLSGEHMHKSRMAGWLHPYHTMSQWLFWPLSVQLIKRNITKSSIKILLGCLYVYISCIIEYRFFDFKVLCEKEKGGKINLPAALLDTIGDDAKIGLPRSLSSLLWPSKKRDSVSFKQAKKKWMDIFKGN